MTARVLRAGLAALVLGWPLAALAAPRVFIETEVSPHDPYVQAATRVIVRLYSARPLYHPELDLPSSDAALVHQVGVDERHSVHRDGILYEVLTRQYLLFPQRSGPLAIPGATLDAQVLTSVGRSGGGASDLGGNAFGAPYSYGAMAVAVEPLELRGEPIALRVRPRPAALVGSYWLPAQQLWVTVAWHPSSLEAHVGDAINLELSVQAQGLTAEQLPDLSSLMSVPSGVKAYADEPKLDTSVQGETLVGTREQNVALIADRAGRYSLPGFTVRWWDTAAGAVREAVVPSRELLVLPALAAATPASAPAQGAPEPAVSRHGAFRWIGRLGAGRDPWLLASGALALLWVTTVAAWLRARASGGLTAPRPAQPTPSASPPGSGARSRSAFLEACRRDDPRAARRYLLAWLTAEWPPPAPRGLHAAAKGIADERIAQLLRELDRACYAAAPWRGEALASLLEKRRFTTRRPGERISELASLYP
ncbi:MAG TPA: hypothetical protein VMU67_17340 [Steroidobacteraceae bacterium]|nr:hypothetical protein [Steroidobacteraceae bacterium]